MVERAIELGFQRYSVVEHAPLPDGIIRDDSKRIEFGLLASQLTDYVRHLKELKRIYGRRIDLLAGLEIDYLPGKERETREMIASVREDLDDAIVSLHCLPATDGFRALDYSPEDFADGILKDYQTVAKVHEQYWHTLPQLITSDFALPPLRRIGHIGLINKYILSFPMTGENQGADSGHEAIFRLLKTHGWAIDYNVGGISQPHCRDVYLTPTMAGWCRKLDISLVYGSDAHGVAAVGRHYERFERLLGGAAN